jgi:hypothetical protein
MPTPTYTALANVTLGSSAASVTFSSIPATYRDLILIARGTSASSADDVRVYYNADTNNANYSSVQMLGTGAAAQSSTFLTTGVFATDASQIIFQIMDYSATDKHKTLLSRSDRTGSTVQANAYRWANTAAVTTVRVQMIGINFAASTTFNLFGIAS